MASLRRILSLECTDHTHWPLQPSRRDLVRHHTLPSFSFYNPQGLPSLPRSSSRLSKARHGRCSHGPSLDGLERESSPHQFAFFRPVPAWCEDDETDSGACTSTRPISRKGSLDTEDSVVYKELCDSIQRLEAPPRYAQVLISEGVLGSAGVRVEEAELSEEESKKKKKKTHGVDVRGRPVSLRMLKRRVSRVSNSFMFSDAEQGTLGECAVLSSNGEARDDMDSPVNSAFSCLVFMMDSLQQHTLWLRRVVMSEADARLHAMMSKVHLEMQETFLWLFQQIFSCTPKLMLLTMMLLVDFAVHSMGKHVALGVMPMGEPPTCAIERAITTKVSSFDWYDASSYGSGSIDTQTSSLYNNSIQGSLAEPRLCEGGAGDKGARAVKVGGSMDGEAMPFTSAGGAAMTMEDDTHGGLNDGSFSGCCTLHGGDNSEEHHMLAAMWQQVALEEHNPMPPAQTRHMLVAPVRAPALEADDYPCYDRTDLKYQHELSRDPSNPLLLANYAQFLHVVRHDHDRAEALYKRAVKADPVDGEVMGMYASFLWVAKEDVEAADEAYKAAMAVDPTNAYHAGSYAHFLWNSISGQEDIAPSTTTAYQQVSTS